MTATRMLVAEFLGTFALVFFGAGAVVMNEATGQLGLMGVALANAMVLAVMVTALMHVSGAHFNPAVTLALWLTDAVDAKRASLYWAAQLIGAAAAGFLVMTLLPGVAAENVSGGAPRLAGDVFLFRGIVIEGILTFFLVSAYYGTAVSSEAPAVGGFAIGLVLLFATLVGGPLTGAALNPARAFGPALASGTWTGHATYWIGPLLGGAAAALVWGKVLLPKPA